MRGNDQNQAKIQIIQQLISLGWEVKFNLLEFNLEKLFDQSKLFPFIAELTETAIEVINNSFFVLSPKWVSVASLLHSANRNKVLGVFSRYVSDFKIDAVNSENELTSYIPISDEYMDNLNVPAWEREARVELITYICHRLGAPKVILQEFEGVVYELPGRLFSDIQHLLENSHFGTIYLEWNHEEEKITLTSKYIYPDPWNRKVSCKSLSLRAANLQNLISKHLSGMAFNLGRLGVKFGPFAPTFSIGQFVPEVEPFVKKIISNSQDTGCKITGSIMIGRSRAGKTELNNAIAKLFSDLGYTIFVVNSDTMIHELPSFVQKGVILCSEAETLLVGKMNNPAVSEILEMFDGEHSPVKNWNSGQNKQRLVVLFSGNQGTDIEPSVYLRLGAVLQVDNPLYSNCVVNGKNSAEYTCPYDLEQMLPDGAFFKV